MKWKCPHCEEEVTELHERGEFSERSYGTYYGTYNIITGDTSKDEHDTTEYDGYESDVTAYECPFCDRELEIDDLIEVIEESADQTEERDTTAIFRTGTTFKQTKEEIKKKTIKIIEHGCITSALKNNEIIICKCGHPTLLESGEYAKNKECSRCGTKQYVL